MRVFPLGRPGFPAPYIITPQTDDEVVSGRATLIAQGDLPAIVAALRKGRAPKRLIEKFAGLID